MKDLLEMIVAFIGICLTAVTAVGVYIVIVATFGFALGLGWQFAVQLWSAT